MKKSIFLKIFVGYITIIFALSMFIFIFSSKTIRVHYINTSINNLKNLGIALSVKILPYLEKNNLEELNTFSKDLGNKINVRITIISSEGVVLSDSEKKPETMENHKNRPEIRQALSGNVESFMRYSTTIKEDMLYVAMPIKKNENILGALRISLLLKDINNLLDNLKTSLLKITAIITFISLLGAFVFSKTLTKPIKELSAAFQKVASGNFDAKVFLKNKDETKDLADNFNAMIRQIKTLFDELFNQKELMNGIISSIQEGLVVLDKDEKIIISNESFKKIVRNNSVENKFYWEVMREAISSELIKKVKTQKSNIVTKTSINDKIYLCSASLMEAQNGITIVFSDITDITNVEKLKADFVTNVSHELCNPLTAIKGFAETLEEITDDNQRHYAEIIKRNTNRLINIVKDLLLLSELEKTKNKIEMEEVNIKNLIENVVIIFKQSLTDKKLGFKLAVENNLPLIKADPFKLEQIFVNLLDNAIKYTGKGSIKLSAICKKEEIEIIVEDTGIGIPKESLSRIFERFYVVDKMRSKKTGGSGLGLSIVKNIVLLHNGKIEVDSNIGVGTKFIITFPIAESCGKTCRIT